MVGLVPCCWVNRLLAVFVGLFVFCRRRLLCLLAWSLARLARLLVRLLFGWLAWIWSAIECLR